jgi:hypothetical protein
MEVKVRLLDPPSYMLFIKLHGILASASPLTIKLSGGLLV